MSSPSPPPMTTQVKAEAGAEADGNGGGLLSITVTSQTAPDVLFRIKRDVRLRRLMDLYCGRHSLDPRAVKFMDPAGRHIRATQTPDEVGLKDGDSIDIWVDQHGGGRNSA